MSNCLMCGPAFVGVCPHKPKAEETWQQRRDRLAHATPKVRVKDYKLGYDQGRADLLEEVIPALEAAKKLSNIICGSPNSQTIKGEIESLALELGHFACVLNLGYWRKKTEGGE